MKLRADKIILLFFILLYSCSKPSHFLIGKWQILHVVKDNASIDLIENWMHFKNNGTFESYDGELKKIEHGKWKYQSNGKKLFIDAAGEDDDSHWSLSMRNDTLIFQSISDNLHLISKRIK
jgi:hypothetical protein